MHFQWNGKKKNSYKLIKYIGPDDWAHFDKQKTVQLPLPSYLDQALYQMPNNFKFLAARLILKKSSQHNILSLSDRLKTIIANSYQPFEIYKNQSKTFNNWDKWQIDENQKTHTPLLADDIDNLFYFYELPESFILYNKTNKKLKELDTMHPLSSNWLTTPDQALNSHVLLESLIDKKKELASLVEPLKKN